MRIDALRNNIKSKLSSSDIAQRMASGAFWNVLGMSVSKCLVLFGGIFCARILGKYDFGAFGMVRTTINMFLVFGGTGLGLTATKYISEYKASQINNVYNIYRLTNYFALLFGLVISLLVFLFAEFLAINMLNSEDLVIPIQVSSVILFVTSLNLAQNGTLAGLENFKAIAINTFIGGVFEVFMMLIGAYFYGIIGAVLGYGFGYVVILSCNHISIKKSFKRLGIQKTNDFNLRAGFKILLSFTLPATLSSIVVAPIIWIIRTMLIRENGFGDGAIFEAAEQWRIIALFVPGAVSQIVLPILSSLVNVDECKFKKVLNINIALNASISLFFAIIICLFSSIIMGLYGDGFTDPIPLILLSFSTIFTAVGNVIGLSISSRAKMWVGFALNSLWGVMVIIFTYLFLSNEMGVRGLSLAILLSYILHACFQYIYVRLLLNKIN